MEKSKNRDEVVVVVDVVVRNFLEKKKETEMKYIFSRKSKGEEGESEEVNRKKDLGFCWLKLGEFGSARLNSVLLFVPHPPPPQFLLHLYWIPILVSKLF